MAYVQIADAVGFREGGYPNCQVKHPIFSNKTWGRPQKVPTPLWKSKVFNLGIQASSWNKMAQWLERYDFWKEMTHYNGLWRRKQWLKCVIVVRKELNLTWPFFKKNKPTLGLKSPQQKCHVPTNYKHQLPTNSQQIPCPLRCLPTSVTSTLSVAPQTAQPGFLADAKKCTETCSFFDFFFLGCWGFRRNPKSVWGSDFKVSLCVFDIKV